jgi:hypothetical protein
MHPHERKDTPMKIQALVAAIALAFAGGAAFAQTGTANSSAGGSGTTANTPSTTTSKDASTSDTKAMDQSMDKGDKSMAKSHHAKKHHHASRHHKHHHVAMNDHDTMESMHHMGASRAPNVDIDSHDRQQRMDHAYDDWQKNHG